MLTPLIGFPSRFAIARVPIGIDFHWHRIERQIFTGSLTIAGDGNGGITAINVVSVEDYLKSVVSSEMSADAHPQLLRAHAVISRSWVLAQLESGRAPALPDDRRDDDGEIVRWYDRSQHTRFDVCADELSELVRRRSGIDFGTITAIEPLQRGESGRIVRLRVTGTRRRLVVGKELEIRRWLSESHLKSSAFIVDRDADGRFIFHGAGWGHGVGLCQIGAAMMANEGIPFRRILSHYYPGSEIERRY